MAEEEEKKETEEEMPSWWQKFETYTEKTSARALFAFSAFIDSWFIFIPPELFLACATLAKPTRWLFHSLYALFFSVLGAYVGYIIGAFFFLSIGGAITEVLGAGDFIDQARTLYAQNAFWTLVLTGITPIPFVPFVLAAGFFKVNIFMFTLAVIIARALRFMPIALLVALFGKRGVRVLLYINRAFGIIGKVILALMALGFLALLVHVLL